MATRSSSCSLCCVSSDLDQNPLLPYLFSSVSAVSTWWVFQSHYASLVLLFLLFFRPAPAPPLSLLSLSSCLSYREYLFLRPLSVWPALEGHPERERERKKVRLSLNLYRDILVFALSLSLSLSTL